MEIPETPYWRNDNNMRTVIIFIIGIQPLGRSGQRPELWYAASWGSLQLLSPAF